MTIPRRRFGVEIECFGLPPSDVVCWLLREKGLTAFNIENYSPAGEKPKPKNHSYWYVADDGSINAYGKGWPVELRSPILSGAEGLSELRQACHVLKSLGAKTNNSCGLHVHVDTTGIRPATLYKMAERYAYWEEDIDRFVHKTRRKSINGSACGMESQLLWLNTRHEPYEYLRSKTAFANAIATSHSCKLDFDSIKRYGTVEFRHHHGTVDPYEISNWVRFCLNFTEVSADLTPRTRRSTKRTRDTGPLMGLDPRIQDYFKLQVKKLK